MKLSDYVIRFIADQGVKHVFMLPGGGAMHLNDSLGQCRDIEYVCNLHEQAAAIAAEAYARVTNHLGVAMVTTGPGGTNAITGVVGAWLDSTPVLILSGQVKRSDLIGDSGLRQLGVQEVDIVSIVRPVTKYAVTVMEPESIRYHLEKAVHLARAARSGPVWIDIPLDVQAAMIDESSLQGFDAQSEPSAPAGADLDEAVARTIELLNRSERPILLAGNGIRMAGAENDFLQLAERLGIPVLTSWLGMDLIPDAHELFMGRPGSIAPRGANFSLQNSDFLLVLGCRMDMGLTGYDHVRFARAARKVIVDVDAAEIRKIKSRVDVPVVVDVGEFIRESFRQEGRIEAKDRSAWLLRCHDWKVRYPVVLPEYWAQTGAVSTYCLSDVISDEATADDLIVTGSSGNGVEIFLLAFRAKRGQRIFHARGLGSMGFAQPAALGACLASGCRRTISVDGDGGFQMNIQELETLARLRLPVKLFVVNNQGYASLRASQQNYFGCLTAADATSGLTLPDVVKVAKAYGVTALRITDNSELREKVREALSLPGPVVCEVMTAADEVRQPRLSSKQQANGSMVSMPLEDLWPFLDRREFLENMIIPPLAE
jgi:acetolactate synthase-1/2/3 large subunit